MTKSMTNSMAKFTTKYTTRRDNQLMINLNTTKLVAEIRYCKLATNGHVIKHSHLYVIFSSLYSH